MDPVTGLSLGRIAVGVAALANPTLAVGVLGLEPAAQTAYVARLFGAREIALGTVTLLASGPARRQLVLVGIAVDVADAATGVLGVRDRVVTTTAGAKLVGPALGAVLSGVTGLRGARTPG